MRANLDHLVIAAATLEDGVAYVRDLLGVDIPPGGFHAKMGTRNHVMQLGGEVFLEVLAVDPELAAPTRPRWFGLDDPHVLASLARRPALLTWVVNTPDIHAFMKQTQIGFGTPEPVSRGDLNWLFGVPDDGHLPAGGMLPSVIQWQCSPHPATRMWDRGCRLRSFEIHHPRAAWLGDALTGAGADHLVEIRPLPANAAPYLLARIETPDGSRELRSW
jgi:hypothetical protein